jgi:hypothetical protein
MRAVVEWLLERRHRIILLAVAMSPVLPLGATALIALETARRGLPHGLSSAALGVGAVLVLSVVFGANTAVLGTLAASSFGAGVIAGALLVQGRNSLPYAFQGMALLCVAGVVLMSLIGPDPRALLGPALDEVIEVMRSGGADEQQLQSVRDWEPMLIGLLASVVFIHWMGSLLLAHWCVALVDDEIGFGEQFRALGLGRSLGLPALLLVALPLVLDAPLIQNLGLLVLFVFLFQGLAVMHAWAHARKWHPVAIAPVYLLLVTPLSLLVLLGLGSVGLVDNVFDLRAPLRAST